MGTKVRATGSDVVVLGDFETTYGQLKAAGAWKKLAMKDFGLDSEQPLERDALIGQGRTMSEPVYGASRTDGGLPIPLDVRGAGFWLKGIFGAPTTTTVKAKGEITFSAQPANNSTITLNSTVWTFVTGSPTGNQTQIGANLAATLTALRDDLNGSGDTEVAKVTYAATATQLTLEYDTAGTGGNAYTIAASANSNGTPSAATLLGGGYSHAYKAGGVALPSLCLELGHPQLTVPKFERYVGVKLNTLGFDMGISGAANADIQAIAQARLADAASTVDGSPSTYALSRFSRSQGTIKVGGTQLAAVTAGRFAFTNNMEPVDEIRSDNLIAGVDEGEPALSGSLTVRYGSDTTLTDPIAAKTPIALTFGFDSPQRWSLAFAAGRVFLPKPKKQTRGPGGIQAEFNFEAAEHSGDGTGLTATLVNDVASY